MKTYAYILMLLIVVSLAFPTASQGQRNEGWFCNYSNAVNMGSTYYRHSFSSNAEAEAVIDEILKQVGLAKNFVIQAASVPNAAAEVRGQTRYILYNPAFISSINNAAQTNWAAISVMAHEVGHHLQGHTMQAGGSRPATELEADKFSGFVLSKMGASLGQAQAAMMALADERGSATHPAKNQRLWAIKNGWEEAKTVGSSRSQPQSRPTLESSPAPTRMPVKVQCEHQTECTHRVACAHPVSCTHPVACNHRVSCSHFMPCQHLYRTWYGTRAAHAYDLRHPYDFMHRADAAHPYDIQHSFDVVHAFDYQHVFDWR